MATLNISLPEPMRAFVDDQVTRGNYGTASEYLRALIREAQQREAQQKLENKLLEALQDEASEMTAEDWQHIRKTVRERALKGNQP